MKKYILFTTALLLALVSCKKEPDYSDAVFMTGTLSSSSVKFLVDGESSMGLTVSSSAKATEQVKIQLAPAPDLLDAYNTANNRSFQVPPAGSYSIEGSEVTIEPGKAISTQAVIVSNSDNLADGVAYCLPVTIESVDGDGLGILESSRTAYVQFTKVNTTSVAQMAGNAWFDVPSFAGESSPVWALKQLTLEVCVRPSQLTSEVNERYINPILGSHESLLLRFGDGSNVPSNKLNFAKVSIGSDYHPDNKPHYETNFDETFENDVWYHIAVVYDGSRVKFYLNGNLEVDKETTGGEINLAMSYGGHGWDDTFAIGRSYGSHWTYKGCVAECRVWTKARTQSELQDGVAYVDPASDGLLAYWRFNGLQDDGTVKDETGHGHDAVPSGNITWLEGQKFPF